MRSTRTTALVLALAVLSVVGMGGASVGTFATSAATQSATIDSCTTIDSPGEYTVAQDLATNQSTCIEITASDVVLDGGGHAIDNADPPEHDGYGRLNGIGVEVGGDGPVSNVTVRNLTGTGWGRLLQVSNLTGGEITGVSTPHFEDDGDLRHDSTGIGIDGSSDLSIHDNTLQNPTLGAGLTIAGGSDIQVRNNTVDHLTYFSNYGDAAGIVVRNASKVTVADNDVAETAGGITSGLLVLREAEDVRVANNTFDDASFTVRGTNSTVVGNDFTAGPGGFAGNGTLLEHNAFDGARVFVGGSDVTVAHNDFANETLVSVEGAQPSIALDAAVRNNSFVAGSQLSVSASSVSIQDNELSGGNIRAIRVFHGEDVTIAGNTIAGPDIGIELRDGATVTGNTITDTDIGVEVAGMGEDTAIRNNEFRSAAVGIHVLNGTDTLCGVSNRLGVHGNAFLNTTEYAIQNDDPRVVNATGNYWDGTPGSPDAGTPLEDPETGDLADGDGGTVTEGREAGVSNVHFDPWLQSPPNGSSPSS